MGVRFECPRGHKLHVKAHLAGERGICPECGVRFIVPGFSGGRVEEVPGSAELAADGASTAGDVAVESTESFNAGLSQALPTAKGDALQWYVRLTDGGQYGPADTDAFRQWIAEGRVPSSSWVWRTGWADWKHGDEAVETFAVEKTRTSPPPIPPAKAPFPDAAPGTAASVAAAPSFDLGDALHPALNGRPVAAKPVDAVYAARARRKRVNRQLTLALGTVAVVLLVVLVIVLTR